MSDIVNMSGLFQQAYRPYAAEQGHDPSLGKVKAAQVSNQTASLATSAANGIADSVYVSAEAAQLYYEAELKRKRVYAKADTTSSQTAQSATAGPKDAIGTEKATPQLGGVNDEYRDDRD